MKRSITVDPPPDLRLTLGHLNGGTGHPERPRTAASAWRASRTPDGPVTLHVTVTGTTVDAHAVGPGAAWELDHLPDLVGAADDPGAFPTNGHRLMRELKGRFRRLRIARTGRVYEALVPVILGQLVTRTEAKRAERALVRTYGEPAPGPEGLTLQPAPEVLGRLRYEDFHPLGIARTKAGLIIEVSRRANRLEEITALDPAAAVTRLESLRGIGPWTSALVVGEALGDPDAVPVGDYHLPNTVAWALAGEARATDARMLELLEPYRPQRYRAALMIKMSGIGAPKYGPRTEVRSFARY
ncbi:MAG: DNA-3-methyladenine glycosylase 2 family protein [Acidimicrobiia bacterium]|nr:DNA-3-methyladenine glycosylase 2 family protein [Acidimicrobiia bacterium]NNF09101.1 DNA-3-methyladenine glycosylase 2 family protein [Acidimicrobiia bacterium]NNL69464.1 DNA-3-methyladenine glycosylase 2 family protein [Acidimicrobiia bacterium]